MLGFLLAPNNMPFAVAITVMVVIAGLEGATSVLGQGLSQLLEGLVPSVEADTDIDFEGTDTSVSGQIEGASGLSRLLGWLHIGRVPILILFVVFLTIFGLSGFVIQSLLASIIGVMAPASVASIPAGLAAVAGVRVLGGAIAHLIPKDETSAVSTSTFIGRVAVPVRGTARQGSPAEAKLVDQHGATHYVLIEPDSVDEAFHAGDYVLIISQHGAVYRAIRNISEAMLDNTTQA